MGWAWIEGEEFGWEADSLGFSFSDGFLVMVVFDGVLDDITFVITESSLLYGRYLSYSFIIS